MTFPSVLTNVGQFAFYKCSKLSGSLIFSDELEYVEQYAFYKCTSLNGTLKLGARIKAIGTSSFYQCNHLVGTLEIHNSSYYEYYSDYDDYGYKTYTDCYISNYAFYECTGFNESLIIRYVESIGEYAFYRCTGLTALNISYLSHTANIKDYAFYECTNLQGELDLRSTRYVGDYAFYKCERFSSITETYYLNSIGSYAFYIYYGFQCDLYLSSNNLNLIGAYAFYGCTGLYNYLGLSGSCGISIGTNAFGLCNITYVGYNSDAVPYCPVSIGLNPNVYISIPEHYPSQVFCTHTINYKQLSNSEDLDESYKLGTVTLNAKDPQEIQNEIEETISRIPVSDSSKDYYYVIEPREDAESLPFNNNLASNQYIKLQSNGKGYIPIDLIGNTLNLIIPNQERYNSNNPMLIIFNIGDKQSVELGLKYDTEDDDRRNTKDARDYYDRGYLELQTTANSIHINSPAKINGQLNIKVPEHVTDFTFEELNLYSSDAKVLVSHAKLDEIDDENSFPINVNKYSQYTDNSYGQSLNSISINGVLHVKQPSRLTFGKSVTIENAVIIYFLYSINSGSVALYGSEYVSGEMPAPPKQFIIQEEIQEEIDDNSIIENIYIARFNNESICNQWKDRTEINGTYFVGARCEKLISYNNDDSNYYNLVIVARSPPKPKKEKKLSGGAIAGIVIACIVVVAAIIVGEYFLIMHFKNKKDASENEAEDVHNEA